MSISSAESGGAACVSGLMHALAARKAKISQPSLLVKMIQNMKANFFETKLQTGGDVALAIRQSGACCARWSKEMCEFIGKDPADYW